jgi:nicotinate-nucleotide--dimethylbenzimidazole phosphoribosyltransferase
MTDLAVSVEKVSQAHIDSAKQRQLSLTKPPGSLGVLEEVGNRLCGIFGQTPPPSLDLIDVTVFAGDHGVVGEGVTPWPQEVTVQMLSNFVTGGAAINVIASVVGARVLVVDVGVASDTSLLEGLVQRKQIFGTKSICSEAAMTYREARGCFEVGRDVAKDLIRSGSQLLVTGDMGIGNTTPAAALIAAAAGVDPKEVVGRGTGIDDLTFSRKCEIVEAALMRAERSTASLDDPVALLSELGGAEIAAIAGYVVGAAEMRRPVLVDGVIALSGALVATMFSPLIVDYVFAGHLSTEPGAAVALRHMGLRPLLTLDMRLGEGTGAALAVPVLRAASNILSEMATFDQAGVAQVKA